MALILKSNTRFSGVDVLSSVADVSQTAQQFYDVYAAWVVSDGGTIINPAATLAAITWAKSLGIMGKSQAVSASWGIKKDGTNTIQRVYGLNGDTYAWLGAAGTHDTSGAFPVIAFHATTGGHLKQEVARRNIRSKRYAMGWSAKPAGASYLAAAVVKGHWGVVHADTALTYSLPGGATDVVAVWEGALPAGSGRVVGFPATVNYSGIVSLVDLTSQSLRAYKDGVASVEVTPSTGQQFADTSLPASSEIWLGRSINGSASSYVGSTTGGSNFPEFWLINDATQAIAQALSQRLGDLY